MNINLKMRNRNLVVKDGEHDKLVIPVGRYKDTAVTLGKASIPHLKRAGSFVARHVRAAISKAVPKDEHKGS